MSKKVAVDKATERAMKKLGELITECRGGRSLRKIAEPSGIAASQLQSIERGILAPTADVYPKLVDTLQPDEKQKSEMDRLYMTIRKTPPPDICELLIGKNRAYDLLLQNQWTSDLWSVRVWTAPSLCRNCSRWVFRTSSPLMPTIPA